MVIDNECGPVYELPIDFIRERWFTPDDKKSPFVRNASPFEDFVIRCVRYAFANIPPNIGRVFFSKEVALPFLRFRMLRHGYLRCPVYWREHITPKFRGLWVKRDQDLAPDLIVFYAHGKLNDLCCL